MILSRSGDPASAFLMLRGVAYMYSKKEYALILSPEFEKLINEIKILRTKMVELILQKNELLYTRKPELQEVYIRCIGKLENELDELHMESVRTKYITDMIRIRLQFHREVNIEEIEKKADGQETVFLPGYVMQQIEKEKEERSKTAGTGFSKCEAEELRLYYRRIIKLLHPDIGAVSAEAGERLLKDAIEAYEYRDIYVLKQISAALEEPEYRKESETDIDILMRLRRKKEFLTGKIEILENSIKLIKQEFPFDMEKLLSDPEKLEKRQKKLEKNISAEKEKLERLKNRLRYYKIKCMNS